MYLKAKVFDDDGSFMFHADVIGYDPSVERFYVRKHDDVVAPKFFIDRNSVVFKFEEETMDKYAQYTKLMRKAVHTQSYIELVINEQEN